jgi:hypothetical protein
MSLRVSVTFEASAGWRWLVLDGAAPILRGAAPSRAGALATAQFAAGAAAAFSRIGRRRVSS